MTKVTIATGLYPPDIGGPATYTQMLEEYLPDRGFELTVVPFGWVRRYPKIVRHAAYARKLWRESKNAEVIYALDPVSVGLPALCISKLRRVPLVVRLGGDYAWEQGRQRFGIEETLDAYSEHPDTASWFVRVIARVQSKVVSSAELVIVPSEYLKRIVSSWRGVDSERIQVIHSALFPLTVSDTKVALRKQLGFTGPTIMTAGRLVPWKGVEALIMVVKQLLNETDDLTLVVAGEGPERAHLEAHAIELGVANHIRFVGRLSKDALGAAKFAADLFVLNTQYEGLSHELLEVMDLKVPIVTTDVGGNPELLKHEVDALLVPYNDIAALKQAVIRLLDSPSLSERYVTNAYLKTKQFEQSVVVNEFIEKINRVCQKDSM